jgi:hypothetical protein
MHSPILIGLPVPFHVLIVLVLIQKILKMNPAAILFWDDVVGKMVMMVTANRIQPSLSVKMCLELGIRPIHHVQLVLQKHQRQKLVVTQLEVDAVGRQVTMVIVYQILLLLNVI